MNDKNDAGKIVFDDTERPAERATIDEATASTLDPNEAGSSDTHPASTRLVGEADHGELVVVDALHYVLGEEIARGGMGRIIRARDRRLGRSIAIKELLSSDPQLERRFEREMRITARLQHPSIIGVLEAGRWSSGTPFYAMKHVRGRPLDQVIAEAGGFFDRLALLPNVIAVADALAYAHDQSVIHRDLKPANVLVGSFGETVVIDWGLAKVLGLDSDQDEDSENIGTGDAIGDQADLTVLGRAMGTPAYMSPAQARGEALDERADVYSLGALLYHVLSGAPPYADAKSSEELLRRVKAKAPTPLRDLEPQVPIDLLAIVDKAMDRDEQKRYASARELAQDLKRFEAGQRVMAHRYSSAALLLRWVKRHRATVVVAASLLLVLVIGTVIAFARVSEQKESAERERGEAENLIGFIVGDLREKLEPIGKLDLLDLMAQKVNEYYRRHPIDWRRSDEVKNRAAGLESMGEVLIGRGDTEEALSRFREAMKLRVRLSRESPANTELRRDLANAHLKIGAALHVQGDLTGAITSYEELTALARNLTVASPGEPEFQALLSEGHARVGRCLLEQGHRDEAVERLLEARSIAEDLTLRDPEQTKWQEALLTRFNLLGRAMVERNDTDASLAYFRKGQAISQRLVELDELNTQWRQQLASTHEWQGDLLRKQGRLDEAVEHYDECLRLRERLVAEDPEKAVWRELLALAHENIGDVLELRGPPEKVEEQRLKALSILQALVLRDPANATWQRSLSVQYEKMGRLFRNRGEIESALENYRASLEIRQMLTKKEPTNVNWRRDMAVSDLTVGALLKKLGRSEKAERHFAACATAFSAYANTKSDFYNAACCHALSGASDEAFDSLEEAFARGQKVDSALLADDDLAALWSDPRWRVLTSGSQ